MHIFLSLCIPPNVFLLLSFAWYFFWLFTFFLVTIEAWFAYSKRKQILSVWQDECFYVTSTHIEIQNISITQKFPSGVRATASATQTTTVVLSPQFSFACFRTSYELNHPTSTPHLPSFIQHINNKIIDVVVYIYSLCF